MQAWKTNRWLVPEQTEIYHFPQRLGLPNACNVPRKHLLAKYIECPIFRAVHIASDEMGQNRLPYSYTAPVFTDL